MSTNNVMILEGTGILSGVHDPEAEARAREETRLKRLAADELLAARCNAIFRLEAALEQSVRNELEAELASRRLSPETVKQYAKCVAKFRAYCESLDPPMPHLPADPVTLSYYLTNRCERLSDVKKALAAISRHHRLADQFDPTDDPIVAAVVKKLKKLSNPADKPPQSN